MESSKDKRVEKKIKEGGKVGGDVWEADDLCVGGGGGVERRGNR